MTEEIKMRIAMVGPDNPNFKGEWIGRVTRKKGSDYLFYMTWIDPKEREQHPTTNKRGYTHRSHYVWNKSHPDDPVMPGQIVHHKNRNSIDDSPENLAKFSNNSEHIRKAHGKGTRK